MTNLDEKNVNSMEELACKQPYDPAKDGAVVAIMIFENPESPYSPNAELAFAFGGSTIIEWTNTSQRNLYQKGINGYTFVFDERKKLDFCSYVRSKTRPA